MAESNNQQNVVTIGVLEYYHNEKVMKSLKELQNEINNSTQLTPITKEQIEKLFEN